MWSTASWKFTHKDKINNIRVVMQQIDSNFSIIITMAITFQLIPGVPIAISTKTII